MVNFSKKPKNPKHQENEKKISMFSITCVVLNHPYQVINLGHIRLNNLMIMSNGYTSTIHLTKKLIISSRPPHYNNPVNP